MPFTPIRSFFSDMENNIATKPPPLKPHNERVNEYNVSRGIAKEEATKNSCTSSASMNNISNQDDTTPKEQHHDDNIIDAPKDGGGNCSLSSSLLAPGSPNRQRPPTEMLHQHSSAPTEPLISSAYHRHSSFCTSSSSVGPAYYHDEDINNSNTYNYMQTSYPPFIPTYPGGPIGSHPFPGYSSVPPTHPCIIHQYIPVAVPVSIVHHYVQESPSATKVGTFPNRNHRIRSNQSKTILLSNGPSQIPSKPISVDEDHSEIENSSRAQSSLSSISRHLEESYSTENNGMSEDCPSRIVSPIRSPKRRRKRGRRKKNSLNLTINEQYSFNGSFHEDDLPRGLISDLDKIEMYDSENEETQTSTPATSTNNDHE